MSYSKAVKYGDLVPLVAEPEESSRVDGSMAFRYPLRQVRCPVPAGKRRPNTLVIVLESCRFDMMNEVVSPNIHALSLSSSVFLKHFSSGNATPTGIFGLFYGIHPTYWAAVRANSAVIDNPVLIDIVKDGGYAFGIYADSQFDRHKIKATTFRGIEIHESFAGAAPDAKDQDLTSQIVEFMEAQKREGRPFLGLAFYKSTHYRYHYPAGTARFRPFQELNVTLPGDPRNLPLYLNHYRNAVSYVDGLVGQIVRRLEASGLLSETIIIVTSDHGEEFNDNGAGYWGHCGNFTEYQTRVPLVMYVPWEKPRQVTKVTAHIDVPTTLVQGVFGCGDAVRLQQRQKPVRSAGRGAAACHRQLRQPRSHHGGRRVCRTSDARADVQGARHQGESGRAARRPHGEGHGGDATVLCREKTGYGGDSAVNPRPRRGRRLS
jgi:membrane-anchored protein YejM (alkaline phosphatase superfamily)